MAHKNGFGLHCTPHSVSSTEYQSQNLEELTIRFNQMHLFG